MEFIAVEMLYSVKHIYKHNLIFFFIYYYRYTLAIYVIQNFNMVQKSS